MDGYTLYEAHNAFNLHFSKGGYDYFKYNGKTRLNKESFRKAPTKWQYNALERRLEHITWFLWLSYKSKGFSYIPPKTLFYSARNNGVLTHAHPDDYLKSIIKTDLHFLQNKYNGTTDFLEKGDLHPSIYEDYTEGEISIETMLLIDCYIVKVFTSDASSDIISWPLVVQRMEKLSPFVELLFDESSFVTMFTREYLGYK